MSSWTRSRPRPLSSTSPTLFRAGTPPASSEATRKFEDLGEAEDWSVAQQKLALAYRGAGNLTETQRLITIASTSGVTGTPMQKVRLSAAQAHILLSDVGTRAQGLALLDETARLALDSGLSRQLRSIESIRTDALTEAR